MWYKTISFALAFVICLNTEVHAQDTLVWTLPYCIQYAQQHNIDLNQNILNRRMAKLTYEQNRLSQIPSLSAGLSYGRSFGRSIDPTTNQFIKSNYGFTGVNGNLDVLLFGWFSKQNSIKSDKLKLAAAKSDYEQLKNNISLNVATGFLRILLAKKQVDISKAQVAFSIKQEIQTEAFVQAGRSPKLDLLQIQSQVASDSAAYFTALNDYQHAILQLKAIMNMNISQPLKIQMPEIKNISLAVLLQYTPEQIFETAKNNFASIKSDQLNIAAARKELAAQKGMLYPQLAFNFQLASNFSAAKKDYLNPHIVGSEPTGTFIDLNGNRYPVMQPEVAYDLAVTPFFDQIKNNFRQTAALTLSIPIFNGWSTRTSIKQAKINVQNEILNKQKTTVQLKQDVYGAYYDAKAAAQKYFSAKKAAEAAQTALTFSEKRYNLQLISVIDFLTTKNQTFKSQSDAVSAKYDLLFKLKILDYYLNRPLKIN